ncbi:MAG: PAS domain S-box protein, partial [Planctomycetota bacterium]|nr:PAS domain S-box protein [Planctomycetota bacterium]
MEKASFELVRQNRKDEAWALLTGPEYQRQKEIYADGMRAFAAEVQAQQENSQSQDEEHHRVSFIAKAATSAFVVLLWCLALWKAAFAWRCKVEQYRAAADSLRASEQRHRTLFEGSRDAMMTLAPPSWKFTSANPATLAMFGVKDAAEFTLLGPWLLSPEVQPDGRPSAEKAKELIETAMREGSHFFEWTHRRLSGEDFPATVLMTRLELAGQVLLQATVRDITAQKRAEEELRKAHAFTESTLHCISDVFYAFDTTGRFLRWNEALLRVTGYSEAELVSVNVVDFFRPEDRQRLAETIAQIWREGTAKVEADMVLKDGRAVSYEFNGSVLKDGRGNILGFSGTGRDLSDRKRLENELRRLAVIAEQAPHGIGMADLDGKLQFVNEAWAGMH